MGIKKYYATKDNTITNAFKADLTSRGTGSNMGAADVLEAFVIHGQTSASISAANAEQSRIIIQFPVDSIQADISNQLRMIWRTMLKDIIQLLSKILVKHLLVL